MFVALAEGWRGGLEASGGHIIVCIERGSQESHLFSDENEWVDKE